jgi:UDP-N-acetylglucosamine 2-epimerase (non-hydrolysing)/GDP/UDP-N,N'-diacetylbacillosamine 2-epimerase (hydrolysing)
MKNKKRKILFVNERRADYSRLKPIMRAVQKSKKLKLQLLVTGMHLLEDFGGTGKIIENDGFEIDAILPMFGKKDKDDGTSMVRGMGKALVGMARIFPRLKPDVIFCGFDLGAHLAAAITGAHLNIPVAHLQGGEVSGTIDEIIRHACTKFSHMHFAATDKSAERIIKLGEDSKYVFNVGSPSLNTIRSIDYFSKEKICQKYGLDHQKKLAILLHHSVTTEVDKVEWQIKTSIEAVKLAAKKYDLEVLAIYSNNDAGGRRIVQSLKKAKIKVFPHIVNEDFLRLLKVADVLIGNSSAGIHEGPSFGLPTVNIGTRQQLRERGQNVIDVINEKKEILKAIEKALLDKEFIALVKQGKNPYDNGDTAQKIVEILENIELPPIQKVIAY